MCSFDCNIDIFAMVVNCENSDCFFEQNSNAAVITLDYSSYRLTRTQVQKGLSNRIGLENEEDEAGDLKSFLDKEREEFLAPAKNNENVDLQRLVFGGNGIKRKLVGKTFLV